MVWKNFDVINKSYPIKAGDYLWYNSLDGSVGRFELLERKPHVFQYDIRYYIGQNKLAYIVFQPDYHPVDNKFTHWTEIKLP